ncbi:YaaR family protein [Alteribacillus sp. HJP-4]|uniref:YaaR family protein n=1 Tax=Alteribacillus sp. HJP-4 TaxID=2775394 RepID=UPI0035CCD557
MEIQRLGKIQPEKPAARSQQAVEPKVSFTEIMSGRRQEKSNERYTQMMERIEDQGKTLAESRTVEELRKYKQMVREFMKDAVDHGLSLEEKRGFNRRGRTKIYKVIEEVDKKLLELTNAVVEKEKNSLEILDMVGEIKGLLVNVYT